MVSRLGLAAQVWRKDTDIIGVFPGAKVQILAMLLRSLGIGIGIQPLWNTRTWV